MQQAWRDCSQPSARRSRPNETPRAPPIKSWNGRGLCGTNPILPAEEVTPAPLLRAIHLRFGPIASEFPGKPRPHVGRRSERGACTNASMPDLARLGATKMPSPAARGNARQRRWTISRSGPAKARASTWPLQPQACQGARCRGDCSTNKNTAEGGLSVRA